MAGLNFRERAILHRRCGAVAAVAVQGGTNADARLRLARMQDYLDDQDGPDAEAAGVTA